MNGVARAIALTALALGLTRCASGPSSISGSGPSPTGGVSLDLLVRHGEASHSRYRVNRDGTLGWAGGFDAVNGNIMWSGPMTSEEIAEFRTMLDANGWEDRSPASTQDGGDPEYQIIIAGPRGREKHKVHGAPDDVVAMEALLQRIARRRHDAYLESFPKPGERRK
jgi:hypothetical protein